jgi:diaminohydroxyphosphoribosylaminopyrimidine deaminase/5-amino-6-(5-phosphoribosylamino)uracil reductase
MAVDTRYMERALTLAAIGGRAVMPNPMVGAVVAKDGEILGEGYHEFFGGPHAEVTAIRQAQERSTLTGATLYVTLEPCSHFGKTPPCADLVIESGISHVVVGCRDPFREVSGKGIEKLRAAGIQVTEDVRKEECRLLNKRFILAHRLKRPYTILKWAQTSDGFIARSDGSSKWISCEASRTLTHEWRAQEMGIMVGTATARVDDPHLTVRYVSGENPVRIVIDNSLSLPPQSNLFNSEADTIIFNGLQEGTRGNLSFVRIDFRRAIAPQIGDRLYQWSLISFIIEGGAKTLQSFIDADLWDEARVFVSPEKFGSGITAPTLPPFPHEVRPSGHDTLLETTHPELLARLGLS